MMLVIVPTTTAPPFGSGLPGAEQLSFVEHRPCLGMCHAYLFSSSPQAHKGGTIIIPISQMRKLRHGELSSPSPGPPGEGRAGTQTRLRHQDPQQDVQAEP